MLATTLSATLVAGLSQCGSQPEAFYVDDPTKPLNAMVVQGESIFPWMTVWGNAAYGLRALYRTPTSMAFVNHPRM